MLGKVRLILWALVGLAAAAGIVIALRPPAQQGLPGGADLPLQAIGGPFTLTGADGKPFGSAQLKGRPYVIFFGFTHCPDVCPTTLARLARLRSELAQGDRPFEILFVTVDPARDGPAEVGAYSGLFQTPIVGLTGSEEAIARVKKLFGIYSEKVGEGDNYTVNHTATVFLMDRDGAFVSTISPEENHATSLAKLRRLTEK